MNEWYLVNIGKHRHYEAISRDLRLTFDSEQRLPPERNHL
jgi:hypothetical protein